MVKKIIANFIVQIGGKPVENVQKALEHVLKKLEEEKDKFEIISASIEEPKLDEEKILYVGFIDIKAKFKNPQEILNFILDYTPVSIEVEDPEIIELENQDFSAVLNDMAHFILGFQSEIRNLRAHIHNLNNQNKNN